MLAATLVREGRRTFDHAQWEAFLVAANDLLRVKDVTAPADAFDVSPSSTIDRTPCRTIASRGSRRCWRPEGS
jgi:hypothetical protein